MQRVQFTILGEPASKANSREIVTRKRRMADGSMKTVPASIKSEKARDFETDALMQIPVDARIRMTGDVLVLLRIFYASRRPDLDESVVLDVLQDRWSKPKKFDGKIIAPRQLLQAGVYQNDRQVWEKHVYKAIDTNNPRVEILVQAIEPQAQLL